jgi:enoyl-CoA hydratase/carnithine racemase
MSVVPTFDSYKDKYENATFKREDGVLEVTLHTDGSDFVWGMVAHEETSYMFEDIARDPENKVVILTGTGDTFIHYEDLGGMKMLPEMWGGKVHFDARRLLMSHLEIEVPIIAAVNGPTSLHSELALLCDIVIASENTTFRDTPHFPSGLVPGDGVHVVWPMILGPNRGRYFLLTGETLDAKQALDLGVVSEVVPRDVLLNRAHELAAMIMARPRLTRQLTRSALVQPIKKALLDNLGYGLMLEGMAACDYWPEDMGNTKPKS